MMILTAPIFGAKHIEGLIFVAILNVVLYFVFKKYVKDERRFMIIALILFYVFEVLKLGYLIIRDGSFPMNHIPLHLCSLPLYAFPIIVFVKKDYWLHHWAKAAGFGVVLIAGITALVMPVNIIGSNETWFSLEDNYLPFISFIYHGLMIFIPWYMVKAGYVSISRKSMLQAMYFTTIIMVIALIVNLIWDKDYMLLNTGNGSPLVFLRDIHQVVYTMSMIALGYIMIAITFGVTMAIVSRKK
ncbi:YwaF family protein [Candidatus Xianfuyuplasma coldseepsis]|uniref:YwaF family protein n=1 Tax=Candidatus Xianfuyuplasma coldseepsis TaxID=2782163 RepID=A0A7L7KSX6_9MOLU|nr:YwaF family protein [Xianfuyuplasma coldseepsis]QMS85509.1 YwaF family protein [Xianfuyuplasma coldseepsis]